MTSELKLIGCLERIQDCQSNIRWKHLETLEPSVNDLLKNPYITDTDAKSQLPNAYHCISLQPTNINEAPAKNKNLSLSQLTVCKAVITSVLCSQETNSQKNQVKPPKEGNQCVYILAQKECTTVTQLFITTGIKAS